MSFFGSSSHYRINGGNFSNLEGDTNEYRYDNSVQVDGQGNSVTYAPQSYLTGSNIVNNSSGQMMIIGQGDNTHIQMSGFGFQGNDGTYQMPQMHVSMPKYDPGSTTFPYPPQSPHLDPTYSSQGLRHTYSSQGPRHFDPRMGQPQQFVPDRTMYQSDVPYVSQRPNVPPAATYTPEPTDAGTPYSPSWGEPPGAARSNVAVERAGEPGLAYYTRTSPSELPPMMPVPSPAHTSTPSQAPVPALLTMPMPAHVPSPIPIPPLPLPPAPPTPPTSASAPPATVQMPIPSSNVDIMTPISPTSLSTPSWSSPQVTPPTSRLSVRAAQPEVRRSPSRLSQDTVQQSFTTPYAYRAVDQTHAHEAPRTTPLHGETPAHHSAVSSSSVQRSPTAQWPASPKAPQTIQTSQSDTISTQPRQIETPLVASGSTSVVVQSQKTQENRVSARPSEKVTTGGCEHELSLDSMPPPAYSLEPETPFQAGETSQELTSVADLTLDTGTDNQENRYSHPITEVVRPEEGNSLPDFALPKKKKKQGWRFPEMFTRRSKRNNGPAVEL